ncbi:MAG: hypothetical protein ACLQGP_39940 [Isosphaeraceae bacterium]
MSLALTISDHTRAGGLMAAPRNGFGITLASSIPICTMERRGRRIARRWLEGVVLVEASEG